MKPPRTHRSDLDEDALFIFDFLWDGDAPLRMLFKDVLPLHANTPHTHSIPDDALRDRLRLLVERRLLEIDKRQLGPRDARRLEECCSLTQAGFAAWELERQPDWASYVVDSCLDDMFTVASASAELGARFVEICQATGVWSCADTKPAYRLKRGVRLLRWKTFNQVHCFDLPVVEKNPSRTVQWALYESQRMWWRTVSELARMGN